MALSLPSPSRRRLFGEQSLNHAPTSPQPTSRNAVQLAKSESTKQVLAPIYKELSPRSRSKGLKPRKSILKTSTSVRNEGGDENEDFTFNYGMFAKKSEDDTMDTMGLPRRVSFARNMAVRWFEKGDKEGRPPADPSIYDPLPLPNGQRPYNAGHVRRPSIPLTATIRELTATPEPPSNVGEESMDVETASEASSEEDEDDQRGEAGQVQFGKFEGQGGQRFSLGRPSAAGRMSMANEDEQDMDVTQVIYGGIRSRASLAQSDGDESIVSSEGVSRTDDERTMDFTVAIGGVLPVAAPEGAKRSRRSLGYALPESPNSAAQRLRPGEAMEGELDLDAQVEMDETVAIGGIVREDDSLSSVESDDTAAMANKERTMTFSFNPSLQQDQTEAMGMDMTVAIGGIVGVAPVSPAWPGHEAATPSFARPTVASAQKSKTTEKRNVFAPSPSPVKSTTPVTKTPMGMTAAGDVAKRLSFGSVTSSGGRKRALSTGSEGEEAAESATKRARPVAVEGVFASTTTTTTSTTMTTLAVAEPSASARASPRKSVGRMAPSPRPAKSPRKSLAVPVPYTTTPIKSPMLRRALGMSTTPAEDRAMKAAAEGSMDTEEMPAIKLSAFLEMAGVGFMEGLPGLQKPRSSIAKGLLSSINGEREIPLYEYTAAQVHSVLRHMYSWAANKMREDIQSLRASLLAEEEECDARNPPVIKEYLASTDEIKALFEMTFKSFKTNTQLKVRGRWYDWKTGLFERVRPEVESVWQGVQEDSEHLTALETVADALLPELESRHAALQAELVKERELARELESCNQDDLLNLRQGVAESTAELNSFAADLKELTCQLDKLQTNLEDLQAQKAEATAAIMRARSRCDQYTKSDIFRLQEEYAGLQSLHLCKVVAVKENIVSLCFDNEVELSVSCKRFMPDLKSAIVRLLPAATTDSSKAKASGDGEDTRLLFATFEKAIETLVLTGSYSTLPSLVQDVSKFWVAVQRMRQEFRHAALHYPVSYSTGPGATGPTTRAIAKIMLPGMRSKVELAFEVDADVLDRWPAAVGSVGVSAHVVYGDAEAEDVVSVAHAAMEIETEPGKIGFLSRACLEVSRSFAA